MFYLGGKKYFKVGNWVAEKDTHRLMLQNDSLEFRVSLGQTFPNIVLDLLKSKVNLSHRFMIPEVK